MGKPNCVNRNYSAKAGSIPGEVKHSSTQRKRNRIDTLSSGERKGHSLNRFSSKQLLGGRGNRDETLEFFTLHSLMSSVKSLKEVTNLNVSRMALERPTKEGDSPVSENIQTSVLLPE
jgi:hypothetical protein